MTPDELRARLGALADAAGEVGTQSFLDFSMELVIAWPAIDALLAAAEADADRLSADLEWCRLTFNVWGFRSLQLHRDAVARRSEP